MHLSDQDAVPPIYFYLYTELSIHRTLGKGRSVCTHINGISCLQVTLKLDPETEIKKFGPKPGPLDEIEVCLIIVELIGI